MPRNMSFAATIGQMRDQSKTVTRRKNWQRAKPGDLIWAVKKGMGLKPGEQIERICLIRIVSMRRERLEEITPADVVAEGFPSWTTEDFIALYRTINKGGPEQMVTRIEFEYFNKWPQ